MQLKDSGNRREFDSGAVRDVQDGKGRCDLLPLDVVSEYLTRTGKQDKVLNRIYQYIMEGERIHLFAALDHFNELCWKNNKTMLLEVAIHYEDGCNKYGDRNWEKGIPLHCYIDSGVRHYLKWLRGDKDEPHERAFVWNMLGALWTQDHLPELCDLPFKEKNQ